MILFSKAGLELFQKHQNVFPNIGTWLISLTKVSFYVLFTFIMVELTGEGRACIPVGLTKTWDGLVN